MISPIKNIANPKAFIMVALIGTAAITGGTALKAQTQYIYSTENDALVLQNYEKEAASKLNNISTINDAKKYFNDLMKELTEENAWKGKTKGVNIVEYLKLEAFFNSAVAHKNSEISKWASKKLEEMEYLKNSDYNKKTLEEDLAKSNSKVDKYEKLLVKLQRSSHTPPNFLMYMFYAQDYQRISEHYIQEQKYCERDISYYKTLNKAERNNVLSSKAVKKLILGQGKKVK